MKRSVDAGECVVLEHVDCCVDGLCVKRVGDHTRSVVSRFVDEIVTLPDAHIFDAMLWLMTRAKVVVEGAAAASVGAVLQGLVDAPAGTKTRLCAERRQPRRGEDARPLLELGAGYSLQGYSGRCRCQSVSRWYPIPRSSTA